MPSSSFVIVLCTFPADGDADALAHALVNERLAACVNILPPMTSVYRWEGNVERAAERQLVIKTRADRVDAVEKRLVALHPYEVPEFLVVSVEESSLAYGEWLTDAVT